MAFVRVGRKMMPVNLEIKHVSPNGHGKRLMLVSLEGKINSGLRVQAERSGRAGRAGVALRHLPECGATSEGVKP
jgi:hypothetical protein